ncbi:MAG: helix-turn-helix transcriptional regulator [Sphaerochaetaceae bacterium]
MNEIDYISIGKRIKYYRVQKGLSQEEFASRISVSRTYLGYLETGIRGLSLQLLVNITNELRVPIGVLLEDSLEEASDQYNTQVLKALINCTPQETDILTKSIHELKKILKGYTIK